MSESEKKIFICEDGGSYGPKSGYGYWSAYRENGRKIDFAVACSSEKSMRRVVKKYYPKAEIVVSPSRVKEAMKEKLEIWGKDAKR